MKRTISERSEPKGTYNMNHLIVALIAEIESKGGTFAQLSAELDGPFSGFEIEVKVSKLRNQAGDEHEKK